MLSFFDFIFIFIYSLCVMSMKLQHRHVPSLLSITSDYVVKNLGKLENKIDFLKTLPDHVKDKMLHQFTTCLFFRKNVNFKQVLSALVHPKTRFIDLTLWTIDDEIINILKICTNVQILHLTLKGEHSVTSKALISLFPNLKTVCILRLANCSAVNDEVIASIAKNCPNLSGLDIDGCTNVTDVSLKSLAPLKGIQWLTLSKTKITDGGMEILISGPSGKNLKELRIAECTSLTELVLKLIADYCPELETLVFYGTNRGHSWFVFEQGILKNLKQLNWTIEW